jgi:hypothetical protein
VKKIATFLAAFTLGGCSQASAPIAGGAIETTQENSGDTPTETLDSPEQLSGQELSEVLRKVQAESAEAQVMDFDNPRPKAPAEEIKEDPE